MKAEKLYEILGDINEKHIEEARKKNNSKKQFFLKWGSLAAAFAIILISSAAILTMLNNTNPPQPPIEPELKFEKAYCYIVDTFPFSSYIGGKVISSDKLAEKIDNVSVTAGWKNEKGEWITTESLRGELYSITGVSGDIAVALKFIDKGEAVTTTHYYVIMNPNADLTPVQEYIIVPPARNNINEEGQVLE